ncbi:MAG: hypothetical protein JRH11_07840 [Deltaproteobacteria bacterium]|nr:hypothetical protein [Deltaproteobacteria bacterium]
MTHRFIAIIALSCVFTCVIGCIATETGNPTFRPTASTTPDSLDGMLLADNPMLPIFEPMASLEGGAGSIDPPTGEVWVWNLDRQLPPTKTAVAADGSFRLEFEAASGELLRMHIVNEGGGLASLPLDLRVTDTGLSMAEPTSPCLDIAPEVLALAGASGSGVIEMTNTCSTPVLREPARLQSETGAYAVEDAAAETSLGATTTLRIEALTTGEPAVVLLPLTAPTAGTRAVSVYQL